MADQLTVVERLVEINQRIMRACYRSGRRPDQVRLIAVTKGQPIPRLHEAVEAGLVVFGENRVQEAAGKIPLLPSGIEWHLIGPLQSNKIRRALELFHTIHSVDRLKIAEHLDREARATGRRLPCFIEVNLGSEPSKHGFPPFEVLAASERLADLENLEVLGLMAIPPFAGEPETTRPWFRRLRELRDELCARPGWQSFPGWLSMGMSADFDVAIEEGATHVRVGTDLFGPRPMQVGPGDFR